MLRAFQVDDLACIAAIVSTTGFAALSLAVIEYGAGRHYMNIDFADARIFYYVRLHTAPKLRLGLRYAIILTISNQFYYIRRVVPVRKLILLT